MHCKNASPRQPKDALAAEDVSMIRQNGKTIATRRKILTRLELEGGFSHGKLVTFQVDTGATCNVLRAQDLPNDVFLKSQESYCLSFFFNGTQKDSLGTCEIAVKNPANGREYRQLFQVVDFGTVSLLGAQAAQKLELVSVIQENLFSVEAPNQTLNRGLSRADFTARFPKVFN